MAGLLDLVIGLVLIYLVFAIVVSGVQEWWSQFRGQRGLFLRIGIARLIDDPAITTRVLQHPLVGALYRDRAARGKPPSYVEPAQFALAFAQVVVRRAQPQTDAPAPPPMLTPASLRAAVGNLARQHSPLADALLPMLDRAGDDLPATLGALGAWYSGAMDRVSGWYKAYAQRRLFVIGLLVAMLGNVDTIAIYRAFNASPDLAARVAAQADAVVREQRIGGVDLSTLDRRALDPAQAQAVLQAALSAPVGRLPIGYACLDGIAAATPPAATATDGAASAFARCRAELVQRWISTAPTDWLVHLLGWVLTALAGTLGAPYWFAALARVVNLRGSGPKPAAP